MTTPDDSLGLAIERLSTDPRLVWRATEPARRATYGRPAHPGDDTPQGLAGLAPNGLWQHQAEAIDLIAAGRDVVVATATSSGKSLCYQLPIIARLNTDPAATALVIQPTKALAHDQLRTMAQMVAPAVCVGYDADTDVELRSEARRRANIVFTNPEMLHTSLLAGHMRWARFWANLTYVVVDELHTYRGGFGSHMAQILRRLHRVTQLHASKPRFVFTSATINDPGRLASELLGSPVEVVDVDGAPRGPRTHAVWDTRQSTNGVTEEAARLLSHFAAEGHRTIVFARSRAGVEAIAAAAKRRNPRVEIEAYRAGYTPDERREIEHRLKDGRLQGVVTTSALEMGTDIGDLDVTIAAGFPGSLTSLRQQAGRVGRRGQHSASILVAGNNQLDRWFATHPDELLSRPAEAAVLNVEALHVVRRHLACAAHEVPLDPMTDLAYWPNTLDEGVCDLARVGLIEVAGGRARLSAGANPARGIGLRSSDGGVVRIEDRNGALVGTTDKSRARSEVHPGARYVHRGCAWQVVSLDLARAVAVVEPDQRGDISTSPVKSIELEVLEAVQHRSGKPVAAFGRVGLTESVDGYVLRRSGRSERFDLAVDPRTWTTEGLWIDFGGRARPSLAAIHAAEHALVAAAGLFAICDTGDLIGHTRRQSSRVRMCIHDGRTGGNGISALLFRNLDAVAAQASALVRSCDCTSGCPSCVVSAHCDRGNTRLDKVRAIEVLDLIAR
ncbi:MAG: DEAD/DEAH box helicase [Acidimicrobiales bacterium]|nr:DEAD/DEAH box helicase [Acidimicrobiales bacterium]